ncbi:MAG: type I-E CRISPR-associated protein Cas7/Cse4/CasC, partial [Pirellulaceae bacterium]|nr:type I-E CRISPR-associated protein Cas7/Cse4/CasC [Pirellulaceae bacterium]
ATKAVRSRETVTRLVMAPLREMGIATDEVLEAIEPQFQMAVYGNKGDKKSSRQPLLLGYPEIEYLRGQVEAICRAHSDDPEAAKSIAADFRKETKANLKAMRAESDLPAGLVSALFGRMVTSDPKANIDAAIHVAHAFTVHAEESESDYFSVVDDLRQAEDDAGADHIGDTELSSGLFYGYVVADVPALVSNLTGCHPDDWLAAETDRTLAGTVVDHLVHLIATVSPGSKLGSTAPYAYADFMLVEAGERQPRTLANAFREPTAPRVAAATVAMGRHLEELDAAYGGGEERRFMAVPDTVFPNTDRTSLPALAEWLACRPHHLRWRQSHRRQTPCRLHCFPKLAGVVRSWSRLSIDHQAFEALRSSPIRNRIRPRFPRHCLSAPCGTGD